MSVIKRDRNASSKDLVDALDKFAVLLAEQSEDDAVKTLREAGQILKSAAIGTASHQKAVSLVINAFEDDHELNAYIIEKPNTSDWTEADELSQAATRVLNLVRRLRS